MTKAFTPLLTLLAFLALAAGVQSCDDDKNESPKEVMSFDYEGTDEISFTVGQQSYNYAAEGTQTYNVTWKENGMIKVSIPEERYANTAMGDIIQGAYVVDSIPYKSSIGGYQLDYSGKASADVTFRGDKRHYTVTEGTITVIVGLASSSVTITNHHRFGQMPMPLEATFRGDVSKTEQ